jgi:hypothetical protein
MAKRQTKKKPLKMEDLGRAHTRENLRRIHPFLRKDFRKLEESEICLIQVLKELFPEHEKDGETKCIQNLYKLHAIYVLQK